MGDEADYLESQAWGYEDDYEDDYYESEDYYKYLNDLMDGKVNPRRDIPLSHCILLDVAKYRLKTGKYNHDYYDKAIKIINDGRADSDMQKRCLYGFIRLNSLDKKQGKQNKRAVENKKRKVFRLGEI